MIVHAFMIELDQPEFDIQEKSKIVKIYAQKSTESLLFSCGITGSGRVSSRQGDIQNFA